MADRVQEEMDAYALETDRIRALTDFLCRMPFGAADPADNGDIEDANVLAREAALRSIRALTLGCPLVLEDD